MVMRTKDKLIASICDKLWRSLGPAIENEKSHRYEIRPLNNEWWIFHNGVGSGEPLCQWIENTLKDLKIELDVPDDEEIWGHSTRNSHPVGIAKWMRDTIILRNL